MPRSSRGMTARWMAQSPASRITTCRTSAILRARHIFNRRRETRHGQGSDAQQQGKEETEGRQEHQEGRRDTVAVLVRKNADAVRPKPDGQEMIRLVMPGSAPA